MIERTAPSRTFAAPASVCALPRAFATAAVLLALWFTPVLLATAMLGEEHVLAREGRFFSQAAVVTFGGAYAVLAYVAQRAVEDYGWLTATDMVRGLALAETTPGPLIMVVAFVGFVGGWSGQLLGADALFASGLLAASVVTFFTFLPSFMFILLGAPFIESTHGQLRFTAPLNGITAAVVGVIVNLAVFFALHVFWPHGLDARPDWAAVLIGTAAFVALWRFRANVIAVIAACGAAGLALQLAR